MQNRANGSEWESIHQVTIEFECAECTALLRTPAARAGDSINCPVCSHPTTVPTVGHGKAASDRRSFEDRLTQRMQSLDERRVGPAAPQASSSVEIPTSQKVCPKCDQEFDRGYDSCPACLAESWIVDAVLTQRREPTLSSILSETWRIFTQNLGFCLLTGLLDLVLWVFAFVVTTAIALTVFVMLQANPHLGLLAFLVIEIVGLLTIFSIFAAGNIRCFLALCRGEPPTLRSMVGLERGAGRIGAAGLLYFGIVVCGLIAGILPGLLLMVRLWPYSRLVVDKKSLAIASLANSFELTRGKFWLSAGIFFIHFVVIFSVTSIPILGPIIVFPFGTILYTVAYLSMVEDVVENSRPASNL